MTDQQDPFVSRQLDEVDSLVAAMISRLVDQMPQVRELTGDLQVEMVNWLRQLATASLEAVLKGESLDSLGPMIEQTARRRRAQGIGRDQTLHAYEVAQAALLDSLTEQLRGHPDEALLFPMVTRRLVEFQRVTTLWVAAGYGHSPEPPTLDRDADLQQLLEIMAGRRLSAGNDQELARRLGLSLPLRIVTVSVQLGSGAPDAVRAAARLNQWSLVGLLDDRVVALTLRPAHGFPAPSGTQQLTEAAPPAEVAAAIEAAARAADVARALGAEQFAAAQVAPLSAMLDLPAADRTAYIESCFGTLAQTARGRALLAAVSATLTHGRSGEAAKALHVHRHTLDYRLARFATETGLDLADPATRFRCTVALFLVGMLPYPREHGSTEAPDAGA